MSLNSILIIALLLISAVLFYFVVLKKYTTPSLESDNENEDVYSIEYLQKRVLEAFDTTLKTNYAVLNLNKYETQKSEKSKSNLRTALELCAFGNIGYKLYVKDYIMDMLQGRFGITEETIERTISFSDPNGLNSMDKFDILLYLYKTQFDRNAMEQFIVRNKLDEPKLDEDGNMFYEINCEQIDLLFARHEELISTLTFLDKLEIVTQKIYQKTYGHGVIDELVDQIIDGINCGTSGIPETFYQYGVDPTYGADPGELPLSGCNAIWLMFRGKKIRLAFMGFGTYKELQRVAKNIYRYNNPGMLSADRGYIVNSLQNGSRVTVSRPGMCEEWVFFIRNFDTATKKSFEELYPYEGNDKMIQFAKWITCGEQNIAITGQQACGKTTFMMNLVRFIRPVFSIRVQELAAELHLRKMFPKRNIVSFVETNTVSSQECVNFSKKTDNDISLLGEISEASVASIGIQMGQVSSRQLMFTHHAVSVPALIKAFRDNLTLAGGYSNEKIAEETVASVLNFNIHLESDVYGNRYVKRITQIMPKQAEDYSKDLNSATLQYYYRETDRQLFDYQDIVVFEDGKYRFANVPTADCVADIKKCLTEEEVVEFEQFLCRIKAECGEQVSGVNSFTPQAV